MTLQGIWWNELRSMLDIRLDPRDPLALTGQYRTSVGQAQQRAYPLVGRCGSPTQEGQVVSWVVAWDPPDPAPPGEPPRLPSTTAWAGQLHFDAETETEFITTTWLLVRSSSAADDWESTMVHMDYFFRRQPTPEMVKLAQRVGSASAYFR